jgi:hypothetical protein
MRTESITVILLYIVSIHGAAISNVQLNKREHKGIFGKKVIKIPNGLFGFGKKAKKVEKKPDAPDPKVTSGSKSKKYSPLPEKFPATVWDTPERPRARITSTKNNMPGVINPLARLVW